ncbi:AraC family transcriptional regulator [Piscinibacter sp.]|uniref:AraC family transcriptional regulator n=1 Tax=Piscinibacter sp. TaxID=1903157 RepID=UPI002F3EFB53
MSERTSSAAWVKGVAEALAGAGLDARALCAEAGIDLDALADSGARCPSEKVSLLWQRAAARSRDPAIALMTPQVSRPANFEVVGYAMMSSQSLHAALERLVRYLRILSDAATIILSERGGECRLDLHLFGGTLPIPGQRYEFDLLTLLNFCRWIVGRELRPLGVEFAHPALADVQRYREAFQCPVRFDAPSNSLLFARADLALPLPTANPMLAELHDRFAGERIERLENASTSVKGREQILRRLPDGEPKREEIAKDLCMSERTLQRRLLEEGTSFQQLLDDTRRELAGHYLGQHKLSFAQAAYLLGFSDQGNFTRACKRWFEMTPGQYRTRAHAPPGVAASLHAG